MFDTKGEPCGGCGREADECVCPLDFPEDLIEELDTDYLDWDYYEEKDDTSNLPSKERIDRWWSRKKEDEDESNGEENSNRAVHDQGSK